MYAGHTAVVIKLIVMVLFHKILLHLPTASEREIPGEVKVTLRMVREIPAKVKASLRMVGTPVI